MEPKMQDPARGRQKCNQKYNQAPEPGQARAPWLGNLNNAERGQCSLDPPRVDMANRQGTTAGAEGKGGGGTSTRECENAQIQGVS